MASEYSGGDYGADCQRDVHTHVLRKRYDYGQRYEQAEADQKYRIKGPEDPKALRGLAVLGQSIVGVGGSVSEKCQKEKESADTGIWSKALAPYADRSSLTKTQLLLCYSGHSRLIMEHQNILG